MRAIIYPDADFEKFPDLPFHVSTMSGEGSLTKQLREAASVIEPKGPNLLTELLREAAAEIEWLRAKG